jgi:anti-sigma factor RsiW
VSECEHSGRLGAYHDGELDAATRSMLEQHLSECVDCAAELARIRHLSRLLGGIARLELSAEALQRLHEAADAASSGPIRRLAAVLTAAAAAILVVCGARLWSLSTRAASGDPMPTWEVSMMQRPAESSGGNWEDQIAAWVVQDLSRENGYGQK